MEQRTTTGENRRMILTEFSIFFKIKFVNDSCKYLYILYKNEMYMNMESTFVINTKAINCIKYMVFVVTYYIVILVFLV